MVIDVTNRNMSLDEFFYHTELEIDNLLEAVNMADKYYDFKVFFNKLKNKIIDICNKVIQSLKEILAKALNKANEMQLASMLKKYDKNDISKAIDKVLPEYLKDHPYYDIHRIEIDKDESWKLDREDPRYEEYWNKTERIFGDDSCWTFDNKNDHMERTCRITKGEESYKRDMDLDEYVDSFIIKPNQYRLISEIILDNNIRKTINDDITKCKNIRDKYIKESEELIGFDEELNENYKNRCSLMLKTYNAKLKMIISNAKNRITILSLAAKELNKSSEKKQAEE